MTNLNQKKIYNLQTIKDYDSSKIDVIYFAGELVSYNLSWHYNIEIEIFTTRKILLEFLNTQTRNK